MHVLALGFDIAAPSAHMYHVFDLLDTHILRDIGRPTEVTCYSYRSFMDLAVDWAVHHVNTTPPIRVRHESIHTPAGALFTTHAFTHIVALGAPSTPPAQRVISYNFKALKTPLPVIRIIL